jgi:hypothetical protein
MQSQLVQLELDLRHFARRTHAVFGKQGHLLWLALAFLKNFDALLPRGLLAVIDLTQIQHVALHTSALDSPALHDGPSAVFLAVFASRAALQIHNGAAF